MAVNSNLYNSMFSFIKRKNFNVYDLIIFLPFISFILGFSINENSAGAGGYDGDSSWIRKNIDIFLNNNLKDAILHPEFFGNRSPLIYVIHKLVNPFFGDFEMYRFCGFIFSLLGPIFFYQFLKNKYIKTDKKILFLISSILYLSPYYRTSAFWGLNENYGIVTSILSLFFLLKVKNNFNILNIFFLILFSSLTVYFDLKLLIIPAIVYFTILSMNIDLNKKFLITLTYFFFSLPYLYLIYHWEGLVPIATQEINIKTITSIEDINKIYQIHFGYCASLIAFYLLPIICFTHKDLLNEIMKMFKIKFTYFILFLIILYILYNFYFFNFEEYTIKNYWVGLGVVHKFTNLVTSNLFLQETLTYIFFLFSLLLILYYFYQSKLDILLLSYFFLISLILWPLILEYFDPIIFILAFSTFNSIKNFNKINSSFLLLYFSIFLLVANVYYL